MRAESGDDWDGAATGTALGLDDAVAPVPGALDANDSSLQVDVLVAESPELAEPQTGVERCRRRRDRLPAAPQ